MPRAHAYLDQLLPVVTAADREDDAAQTSVDVGGRRGKEVGEQPHQLGDPGAGDRGAEEHRVRAACRGLLAEATDQLGPGVCGSLADGGREDVVVDVGQ